MGIVPAAANELTNVGAEFVRARPVFRRLGMSDRAAYLAIRQGRFPLEHVVVGGIMKFRVSDVERFVAGETDDGH